MQATSSGATSTSTCGGGGGAPFRSALCPEDVKCSVSGNRSQGSTCSISSTRRTCHGRQQGHLRSHTGSRKPFRQQEHSGCRWYGY